MRNNTNELPPGPPHDRLWTEEDLASFFAFKSVGELIERHPDFPPPLPLRIRGRRWRPSDVLTWTNGLVSSPANESAQPTIPPFDISTITDILKEA